MKFSMLVRSVPKSEQLPSQGDVRFSVVKNTPWDRNFRTLKWLWNPSKGYSVPSRRTSQAFPCWSQLPCQWFILFTCWSRSGPPKTFWGEVDLEGFSLLCERRNLASINLRKWHKFWCDVLENSNSHNLSYSPKRMGWCSHRILLILLAITCILFLIHTNKDQRVLVGEMIRWNTLRFLQGFRMCRWTSR